MSIGQGYFVEGHDTEEAVAPVEPGPAWEMAAAVPQVEPGPTWREALSAHLRPSDHHVSDEEIFAILNGGSEGVSAAELCAARGVTMPMYCVWKSKYRQLDLDQLSAARRREQRRRHTVSGLLLLAALSVVGGIAASLVWTVSSTFKGRAESAVAIPAVASDSSQSSPSKPQVPAFANATADKPSPQPSAPSPKPQASSPKSQAPSPKSQAPVDATPAIIETGYRIQVTAETSAGEGRAAVARLVSKGYPAYMTQAVVGDKEVFRVRVGPFDTLSAAEEVATRLRSDGYGGAWIAR